MLKIKIKNNLKTAFKTLSVAIIILIAMGCSKLHTDIPLAPAVTIHKEGITNPDSKNFHGNLVRLNGWDLLSCQQCHASDYNGGIAEASCLNCHTNTGGPEACNTCHGDLNDLSRIAPPRDINKNTVTDSAGVGAHVKHLYDNQLGSQILCSTCHNVPQDYFDPGHAVDDPYPAEVIFGNLAIYDGGANAGYNFSNATCSDVYCHGSFEFLKATAPDNHKFAFEDGADRMIGNNRSVVWNNVDGSQAECGSCHELPPVGHVPHNITACGTCHSGIFDGDGNLVDSLSYKHINGEIDLVF